MRLDHLRRSAHRARLDHVRIKRPLHQPLDLALGLLDAQGFFFEYFDEFVADNLALLLGLGYALTWECVRASAAGPNGEVRSRQHPALGRYPDELAPEI